MKIQTKIQRDAFLGENSVRILILSASPPSSQIRLKSATRSIFWEEVILNYHSESLSLPPPFSQKERKNKEGMNFENDNFLFLWKVRIIFAFLVKKW